MGMVARAKSTFLETLDQLRLAEATKISVRSLLGLNGAVPDPQQVVSHIGVSSSTPGTVPPPLPAFTCDAMRLRCPGGARIEQDPLNDCEYPECPDNSRLSDLLPDISIPTVPDLGIRERMPDLGIRENMPDVPDLGIRDRMPDILDMPSVRHIFIQADTADGSGLPSDSAGLGSSDLETSNIGGHRFNEDTLPSSTVGTYRARMAPSRDHFVVRYVRGISALAEGMVSASFAFAQKNGGWIGSTVKQHVLAINE